MTRHIIMYGCEDVKAKIKSKEEFYKLKYCSTVVYMVPRA